MRKHNWYRRFLCLLVISLILAVNIASSMAAPVNQMPGIKPEMMHPEYWISKMSLAENIIMVPSAIEEFNHAIIHKLPTLVYDLNDYPQSLSRDELRKLIERPYLEDPMYIGPEQVNQAYLNHLSNNTNLANIKAQNSVQYGFTVCRTQMREYPTGDVVSDEVNDIEFDLFQDTALLPFEPLILLHQSSDKQWYFAQMYNCSGWVPATDVAFSLNRNEWKTYQQNSRFLLVSGNRVRLCQDPYSSEVSELELPMGTIVPLADPEKIPALIDGQAPTGNYVVEVPVRKPDGQTDYKLAMVPCSADVNEGFLPYTRANTIRQAFKLQGDRYGWGGMLDGRDCSSLVMDVYRCFGFRLPRNSEQQAESAGKTVSFNDSNLSNRQALLDQVLPGASLHFPGHTMIYLGKESNVYYVISALGSWAAIDPGMPPQIQRIHGVVVNNLYLTRKNGKTWMESLTVAKQYEN
ncbi:MAG TPA: SH3 domain-containing protein [Syntrophomonadaceae bacterium]|nr:SH3 domain-containing protein [Syntrophomonadaceae bacterium]